MQTEGYSPTASLLSAPSRPLEETDSDKVTVMTYNTRTPNASYPGGEDAGPSNPHYWVNRQQHIVDEMRLPDGSFPTIMNLQEADGLQIEGGKDPCNPSDPNRITGLLDLLNEGQPGRYKVLYLKDPSSGQDWKNDDAILYDSSKVSPVDIPGANQAVSLESNDPYGQRYAHIAAFQMADNPAKRVIVGDAHAQKNSAGGLTDSDAKAIAKTMSEMAAKFGDANGPAKSIFTADANRGDLNDKGGEGADVQHDLENISSGGSMANGYDDPHWSSDGSTSGLWDKGPGPHGRREDSIWTNGELVSLHQADREKAAPASDHIPVWAEIQI